MSAPLNRRFVDALARIVPKWLSAWLQSGRTVGWRFLWTMVVVLDIGVDVLVEGIQAWWPGIGTPTALSLIGRSRGLLRGIGETTAAFAAYLRSWRDLWKRAGQQLALAKAVSHYCGGVKVKSFNRAGTMVTVNEDGTTATQFGTGWDWDSLSNPDYETLQAKITPAERWSELWLVVYTPPWAVRADFGSGGNIGDDPDKGVGPLLPRVDVDGIKGLLTDWKRGSSRVVCVCFTYDATLFDPSNMTTMPDGFFGKWGRKDPTNPDRIIRSRFANVRYWEPSPYYIGGPKP